jgi:beta-N-acetylhexosaminidase
MVMAVEAGIDLLALGPSFGLDIAERSIAAVVAAVESGRIPEARIDESVERILATKERFGLYDWKPLDPATAAERVGAEEHAALIEELFRAGVTVAYDRNDLLPLRDDQRIAIIFLGTRYQIQNECKLYDDDVQWVAVSDAPSGDEIGWASRTAAEADVAVVWTQNADRTPEQQALVNAMPQEKTVAVSIWSVYDWLTYPNVAAYVATYSPARPAVPAACAILFGEAPARGQLALTLSDTLVAGSRAE